MAKQKYYAVKVGRVPGIYQSWDECTEQVYLYENAKYKSFATMEEAQMWLTEEEKILADKTPSITIPDGPYAFVDGSFNPNTQVYGYGGFLNVNGQKYPLEGNGTDPEMASMRNVAGEIEGSMAAVRKAEELGVREITILYDYQGIEKWTDGTWHTNKAGTEAYSDFMNSNDRTVSVRFQKVPAHTGVEGNEMADAMAKHAVGITLTKSQQALYEQAYDGYEPSAKEQPQTKNVTAKLVTENLLERFATMEDYKNDLDLCKQLAGAFGMISSYLRANSEEGKRISAEKMTEATAKASGVYDRLAILVATDKVSSDCGLLVTDKVKGSVTPVFVDGNATMLEVAQKMNDNSQKYFAICNEIQAEQSNKSQSADNTTKLKL